MKRTLLLIVAVSVMLSAAAHGFPVSVTDESGAQFTALGAPQRIISTMPSVTEILFALGLGNKIVGDTTQCNYPPEAKKVKKIGSIALNNEEIVALNPDLVVMLGDAQKKDVKNLKELELPVFVINPHSINQLMGSIRILGEITGSTPAADRLIGEIKTQLFKEFSRKRPPELPRVFVVLWAEPLTTAGTGTFINDLIRVAGGNNIGAMAGTGYPQIGFETVLSEDPDYIIVSGKTSKDVDAIKNDENWKMLRAVKTNKVMLINSDIITRPAPRLMKALEKISSFINPEN